jgi:hypothetical protein
LSGVWDCHAVIIPITDAVSIEVAESVAFTVIAGITVSVPVRILLIRAADAARTALTVAAASFSDILPCNARPLAGTIRSSGTVVSLVTGRTVNAGFIRNTVTVSIQDLL